MVVNGIKSHHAILIIISNATIAKVTDLLALLYVMFSCVFVTFPYGVLGQVWYLIVSIPDLCLLSYFYSMFKENNVRDQMSS